MEVPYSHHKKTKCDGGWMDPSIHPNVMVGYDVVAIKKKTIIK
jgi:hypothetical protein